MLPAVTLHGDKKAHHVDSKEKGVPENQITENKIQYIQCCITSVYENG